MRTIQTLRRHLPGDWKWEPSLLRYTGICDGRLYVVAPTAFGFNGWRQGLGDDAQYSTDLQRLITKLKELP